MMAGQGGGSSSQEYRLHAEGCYASRNTELRCMVQTCEALSEALTSAGQKTGPCPLAEASYNTPGSAARHGIEARLLNSPSRCRMLLSTIAKLEAKCCSIGGAAKDGTGEAAKQALQGTWHCIAAAVAAGVNSGGLCNADGAERSSPLEWGEAVKELGSHFLVSACLAARSCRLSSRDGNQDASDVLRDEEHTLGSQLATLRELHPEALLSPTAASPIDPEIWATPRDAAPTDPEVGTDNPTPGRSGGNEVALAAAASPRRAHLGGVSLLLGLGHSPTGMSRNTNPEGRAEAGGLAGGGGSRGQEVPGPVFCAASKVILACVIRTAARSPGSEPGGSGSQSRPTWERQLAAMAEWLLQGSCESGRLSAAASLLGDLLQMERELSQLFANTSDWGRNGEKGLGVAHRVQAALLAVWLGVVQGCRGPAQVAGGGVAEAAVHTVLLFPLAVLLQPCRAPEPHVDLETLCRAWEEAHARLAGPSAESQLASSKLCAAANQLLCYSGVDWRSMSRPLRPLASCMATSFGCTVEQLAALEAAPCIAADERCTGPSVHTGRTIVQGAPSARRGLVPASSASPQHQGEETPHGQDPRGSPKPRGAPGNRRRSPSPMSGASSPASVK